MLYFLRNYNYISKIMIPANNVKIQIDVYNLIIRTKMSTVTDDMLNEPHRNLNYVQLLQKKKSNEIVLIDVREHSEIKDTGKLPGSINIPLNEIEKALRDLSPTEFSLLYKTEKPSHDMEIIFSCRSGKRSLRALKTALELNYKNAAHYKGGWLDWEENSKKGQK